jgi:hypothetical protein
MHSTSSASQAGLAEDAKAFDAKAQLVVQHHATLLKQVQSRRLTGCSELGDKPRPDHSVMTV